MQATSSLESACGIWPKDLSIQTMGGQLALTNSTASASFPPGIVYYHILQAYGYAFRSYAEVEVEAWRGGANLLSGATGR
jgi:hypothetical protein